MNEKVVTQLRALVLNQQVASLGSLRSGAPQVTMVQYAVEPDLSSFYLHLSTLAHHTGNILADPRVSLMVMERFHGDDPQTMARVSIMASAAALPAAGPEYQRIKGLYLEKFPAAARSFQLGDFSLYRLTPNGGRFVAGFGQIYNLKGEYFARPA